MNDRGYWIYSVFYKFKRKNTKKRAKIDFLTKPGLKRVTFKLSFTIYKEIHRNEAKNRDLRFGIGLGLDWDWLIDQWWSSWSMTLNCFLLNPNCTFMKSNRIVVVIIFSRNNFQRHYFLNSPKILKAHPWSRTELSS